MMRLSLCVEDTVLDDNNQFSEELNVMQIQQIMENENMSKEREKCIMNISKSTYELNSLFKDLAKLVVNQGTILDRIQGGPKVTTQLK
uniref:t-SNARE coiled-coil homology domain-containing protein n=1 Tax=Strongyloides papillosus TaxID=174720 RepID=A0A0N5CI66_STREA